MGDRLDKLDERPLGHMSTVKQNIEKSYLLQVGNEFIEIAEKILVMVHCGIDRARQSAVGGDGYRRALLKDACDYFSTALKHTRLESLVRIIIDCGVYLSPRN